MRGAYSVYVLLTGVSSLSYPMVWIVSTVYLVKVVGLDPLQIVLYSTVQQLVNFLFQAPTGALADMYGRRRVIVPGFLLVGIGFLLQGAIPVFVAVLGSQALTGLGASLVGGADAAWIADELGAERVGQVYLRASQIGSLAGLLGIAASAGLAGLRLNLPILVSGGLFAGLGLILAVVMPEHHFTPTPREQRTSWQHMGHTLRAGVGMVQVRPLLRTMLGIGVFYGVFSAGFDQLWQYHLLRSIHFPALAGVTPVVWFGIIEVGITLTNLIGSEIARRRVDVSSHQAVAWALFIVDGLTCVSAIGFALSGQLALALAAFFVLTTARGPRMSLEQIWMNQHLDASVRATVFSLRGGIGALAQIVAGPLLGALATSFATRPALLVASVMLVPALLLYSRILRLGSLAVAPIAPPSP